MDKKKGNITNLNVEFVISKLKENCIYCEFPSTGLDRIDNHKGHTIDNCVSCCRECNLARSNNFTFEEMKIIGQSIKLIKLNRQNNE